MKFFVPFGCFSEGEIILKDITMSELPNVNAETIEKMQRIAGSREDGPVFMLNLNKYTASAGFPHGELYKKYMISINRLVDEVEGKILWQTKVNGQVVGNQDLDEVLGVWYPSHQSFLSIRTAPSSARNMELRSSAVQSANLQWCNAYTVKNMGGF